MEFVGTISVFFASDLNRISRGLRRDSDENGNFRASRKIVAIVSFRDVSGFKLCKTTIRFLKMFVIIPL